MKSNKLLIRMLAMITAHTYASFDSCAWYKEQILQHLQQFAYNSVYNVRCLGDQFA